MSILVNGSLTKEFGIERGLRQGNLLSTFLYFLVIVKGFNLMIQKDIQLNLFEGKET